MNKLTLAVLASISLLTGCVSNGSQMSAYSDTTYIEAPTGPDKTYVVDSYGAPVHGGSDCVVAADNSGTYFEECDSSKMGAMQHAQTKGVEQAYKPAPAPKPRVITKVIVDCAKCKY